MRSWSSLLCALWVGLVVGAGCRSPEPGGKRRTTSDPRPGRDTLLAAYGCDELQCIAPARCEMKDNAARCVCPSGYEGDPSDCQDVDECASSSSNDCAEHAVCTN